jgi:hypothetical protein
LLQAEVTKPIDDEEKDCSNASADIRPESGIDRLTSERNVKGVENRPR